MIDDRIQALARRFNETGEGEVELLQAKLNAGVLTQNQVAIAAHCGHSVARSLVDRYEDFTELRHWIELIPTISNDRWLATRTDIAALAALLPKFEELLPEVVTPRIALMSSIRCVLHPTNAHRRACMIAHYQVTLAAKRSIFHEPKSVATYNAAWTCAYGASRPLNQDRVRRYMGTINETASVIGDKAVVRAICHALTPWALGYKDPLIDLLAELEQG